MRAVEASMPGKSKLTADAAEQTALRGLSKSEHRDEADRARAILLTLQGRRAEEIAATLGVHISTVRNWRGYFSHGGGAGVRGGQRAGKEGKNGAPAGGVPAGGPGCGGVRGRDSRPRSGRMPERSRRRS